MNIYFKSECEYESIYTANKLLNNITFESGVSFYTNESNHFILNNNDINTYTHVVLCHKYSYLNRDLIFYTDDYKLRNEVLIAFGSDNKI